MAQTELYEDVVLGSGAGGKLLAWHLEYSGRRGVAVRVATLPMGAVLRTRTTRERRGFMKALLDTQTDRILGFTMFGPEAGEVMAVVQTAMLAGLAYMGLAGALSAHPTIAGGLNSA